MKPGYYLLRTDGGIGAAPGQAAGEAAIGVVLENSDGSRLHELSMRIGRRQDHHVAEYEALIAGLRLALGHGVDRLRVFLDSRLVVEQLAGDSKVTKEHLRKLRDKALALLENFTDKRISWVPREENTQADALVNRALAPTRAQHPKAK